MNFTGDDGHGRRVRVAGRWQHEICRLSAQIPIVGVSDLSVVAVAARHEHKQDGEHTRRDRRGERNAGLLGPDKWHRTRSGAGLAAVVTVDFACAAVSLAASARLRSPLVSASFGATIGSGGLGDASSAAFAAGAFLAGAAFLAAFTGVCLAAFAFLAGSFFASGGGGAAAGGGGGVAGGGGVGGGAPPLSSGRSC